MNTGLVKLKHHWKVHSQQNHLLVVEEAGGEIISEEEEETSQEEDVAVVLQMLLVEDIIKTKVSQVVAGLINKKFNFIIVRNLVIMHMNAGRSSIPKEGKSRINQ